MRFYAVAVHKRAAVHTALALWLNGEKLERPFPAGDSERALPYLEKAQAIKATPYVAEMIHKLRATQ